MNSPSVARALLASAVDYAGLFPPASLPMAEAFANYSTFRRERDPWMLGSFVVPLARVAELVAVMGESKSADSSSQGSVLAGSMAEPLPASVLLGSSPDQTVDHVEATRERFIGVLEIGSIEVAPLLPDQIPVLAAGLAEDLTVFFESPVDDLLDERLAAVADAGACAKIRCGGVTTEAIPSVLEVARFVSACRARSVPFKATAGLHHAIRGPQPLTYEENSERAWMHGFVNLSVAAALIDAGKIDQAGVAEVLSESAPTVFRFAQEHVSWRDLDVDTESILRTRRSFFHCFGSCSYREPRQEIGELLAT